MNDETLQAAQDAQAALDTHRERARAYLPGLGNRLLTVAGGPLLVFIAATALGVAVRTYLLNQGMEPLLRLIADTLSVMLAALIAFGVWRALEKRLGAIAGFVIYTQASRQRRDLLHLLEKALSEPDNVKAADIHARRTDYERAIKAFIDAMQRSGVPARER